MTNTFYDGHFVSTWLGLGIPRQLLKHYFGVSVRTFLEEVSIWIDGLSKGHQRQLGIIHTVQGLDRTKGSGSVNLLSCLSQDIHLLLPLDIWTPGSWALRLRLELTTLTLLVGRIQLCTRILPLAFLGRQLADGRLITSINMWTSLS